MAIFNFLENFFFISLAITFGLLLMLVYHFKERICLVEKKNDTLNEVLTNVVKEIKYLRGQNMYLEQYVLTKQAPPEPSVLNISLEKKEENVLPSPENIVYVLSEDKTPSHFKKENGNKIVVSDESVGGVDEDDEDEDEDTDDESESESEDTEGDKSSMEECSLGDLSVLEKEEREEEDTDDSDDEDEDEDNIIVAVANEVNIEVDLSIINEAEDPTKIEDVMNTEHTEPISTSIIEDVGAHKSETVLVELDGIENETDLADVLQMDDVISHEDIQIENIVFLNSSSQEPQKKDEKEHITTEPEPDPEPEQFTQQKTENKQKLFYDPKKEVYRKMSIHQLRSIATSAGLTTDTTKMKKAELIKLLETLDDENEVGVDEKEYE